MGEAVIEAAAARAADANDHAVEDRAARFVDVEAFVEQMAQEATRLRGAVGDAALHRKRAVLGVERVGGEVPQGREAESDERRILGDVDELVDRSPLRTRIFASGPPWR